jgi:putative transposase
MTPQNVHYGLAEQIIEVRSQVLKTAFLEHPNRFKGNVPKPLALPKAAWINKPSTDDIRA